jgi:hypothetical protein
VEQNWHELVTNVQILAKNPDQGAKKNWIICRSDDDIAVFKNAIAKLTT